MTHPQPLERNLEHTPALNGHSAGLRLLQPYLRRAHARSAKRWARAVEKCVTIDHLRQVMEQRVPPIVREYYRGGPIMKSRSEIMSKPFKESALSRDVRSGLTQSRCGPKFWDTPWRCRLSPRR